MRIFPPFSQICGAGNSESLNCDLRNGRRGGKKDWESGISRHKLVYGGQINKVLRHSTGNDIHYSVINQWKRHERNIYIHIYN